MTIRSTTRVLTKCTLQHSKTRPRSQQAFPVNPASPPREDLEFELAAQSQGAHDDALAKYSQVIVDDSHCCQAQHSRHLLPGCSSAAGQVLSAADPATNLLGRGRAVLLSLYAANTVPFAHSHAAYIIEAPSLCLPCIKEGCMRWQQR